MSGFAYAVRAGAAEELPLKHGLARKRLFAGCT